MTEGKHHPTGGNDLKGVIFDTEKMLLSVTFLLVFIFTNKFLSKNWNSKSQILKVKEILKLFVKHVPQNVTFKNNIFFYLTGRGESYTCSLHSIV